MNRSDGPLLILEPDGDVHAWQPWTGTDGDLLGHTTSRAWAVSHGDAVAIAGLDGANDQIEVYRFSDRQRTIVVDNSDVPEGSWHLDSIIGLAQDASTVAVNRQIGQSDIGGPPQVVFVTSTGDRTVFPNHYTVRTTRLLLGWKQIEQDYRVSVVEMSEDGREMVELCSLPPDSWPLNSFLKGYAGW